MKIDVDLIADTQGLDRLGPQWTALSGAGQGNVHTLFDWLVAWWHSYQAKSAVFAHPLRLMVIVLRRGDGTLWGIAPLMVEDTQPPTVRFLGEGVSDYADVLVTGERRRFCAALLEVLGHHLGRAGVDLRQFPESSPNYPALMTALADSGIQAQDELDERCPFLAVQGTWQDYYATVSKSHRDDVARCCRRLSDLAELTCRRHDHVTPERLAGFADINRARQQRLGHASLYDNPFKLDFVRRVTPAFNQSGAMRAWSLELGGQMIAYVYGFLWDNVYFYWNIGLLPEYARYSPGKVLLARMLEAAFAEGLTAFDFMRGDESYKFIWARGCRDNRRIRFKVGR